MARTDVARRDRRLTARGGNAYKRGPTGWAATRPDRFFGGRARFSAALRNEESEFMANTKSAQKAVRKIARRTAVNKSRRSQMRTYVRKVEDAIAAKDADAAAAALRGAEPLIARAAQKGILHKNAASRKISRLAKRVKALAG
jgi:small subunit ribosomal protein S20